MFSRNRKPIRIKSSEQVSFAVGTVAVKSNPLPFGVYDIWCDAACYVLVRAYRNGDGSLATIPDATVNNGYFLSAGRVVSIKIQEGDIVGVIATAPGNFKLIKTGDFPRFGDTIRSGKKYDAATLALFARMPVQPDYIRRDLVNDRMRSGKEKPWWQRLSGVYVHAAHEGQAGRLNWKGPIYDCLPVNNPAFTVDRGYMGNGSSSYLDTQFNPATAGDPFFTQDSACLGIRSNTENVGTGSLAGFYDTTLQRGTTINPRIDNTNSVASFRVNTGSAGANTPNGAVPSSVGMFVANRTSSAGVSGYRNGVKLVAGTQQPSVPLANGNLRFGSINNGSYRACQFSMSYFGGGLTDAEVQDIHDWFEVYRLAVGIP